MLCNLESEIQKLLGSNPLAVGTNKSGASRDTIGEAGSAIIMECRAEVASSSAVYDNQLSALSAGQRAEYTAQSRAGNVYSLVLRNIYCIGLSLCIGQGQGIDVIVSQSRGQGSNGSVCNNYVVVTQPVVLIINNDQVVSISAANVYINRIGLPNAVSTSKEVVAPLTSRIWMSLPSQPVIAASTAFWMFTSSTFLYSLPL